MALLLSRKHTECLCFDSHLYSFDLPILYRDEICTNKLCRFSYPLAEIDVKRTRTLTRPRCLDMDEATTEAIQGDDCRPRARFRPQLNAIPLVGIESLTWML